MSGYWDETATTGFAPVDLYPRIHLNAKSPRGYIWPKFLMCLISPPSPLPAVRIGTLQSNFQVFVDTVVAFIELEVHVFLFFFSSGVVLSVLKLQRMPTYEDILLVLSLLTPSLVLTRRLHAAKRYWHIPSRSVHMISSHTHATSIVKVYYCFCFQFLLYILLHLINMYSCTFGKG